MRIFQFTTLFSISCLAIAGCTETSEPSTKAMVEEPAAVLTSVNTHCPVMGSEVTADGGSVDFGGKTVGFCCPGCIDDWNKLSDDDKTAKLASAGKEKADTHDHSEHAGHEEGKGGEPG